MELLGQTCCRGQSAAGRRGRKTAACVAQQRRRGCATNLHFRGSHTSAVFVLLLSLLVSLLLPFSGLVFRAHSADRVLRRPPSASFAAECYFSKHISGELWVWIMQLSQKCPQKRLSQQTRLLLLLLTLPLFFFFFFSSNISAASAINNMTFNCWAITDESKTNKALVVHLKMKDKKVLRSASTSVSPRFFTSLFQLLFSWVFWKFFFFF